MYDLEARQASIDRHLECARKCLASPIPHLGSSKEGISSEGIRDEVIDVDDPRQGARTAAKILHLQNLIATLTPVPATTEADQYSVFDRILAGVETLWIERRDREARDPLAYQRLVAYADPPIPRSSDVLLISASQHRRAGSSRL